MLRCELPRRARTPQKDRSAKGSFRFPFSRTPRSPTSPTIFISTNTTSLHPKSHKRSGSSLSDIKLPFGLSCSGGRDSADKSGGGASPSPAVPPKDLKRGYLTPAGSAESLLTQAHVAATVNFEFRGGSDMLDRINKRASIPEELLSASALRTSFERRPPLERSFSFPLPGVSQRTTSFAEHLDQRRISSAQSSPVSTDSEADQSDASRGRSRRAPPPPIKIPQLQHRRKVSVPINSDLEAEKLPSIAIGHRRNPTPPSSTRTNSPSAPFAVRPPSLQNLAPLLDLTRASVASANSTDSGCTITPAQIIRADRISSVRQPVLGHRAQVSISRPPPIIVPGKSEVAAPLKGTVVAISPPGRTEAPPLTATAFPSTPIRNSVAFTRSTDKHFSTTSFDIQTLPFLFPSDGTSDIPPVPALPSDAALEVKSHEKPPPPALLILPTVTLPSGSGQPSASSTSTTLSPSNSAHSSAISPGTSPSSASSSSSSIPAPSPSNLPCSPGSLRKSATMSDLDFVRSLRGRTMMSTTPGAQQDSRNGGKSSWEPVAATVASETIFVAAELEVRPPPLPFPWKSESLSEAKKALSSKQLQDIMTNAIKASADHSPELVIEGLSEIPSALASAKEQIGDVRAKLQGEMATRARNLSRHVTCLRAFNGNEGARFAQSLLKTIAKSDQLAAQMHSLTEHTAKLELLQERHYRAATTLSLVKLNGSFVRTKESEKQLRHQLEVSQREKNALALRLQELERKYSELSSNSIAALPVVKGDTELRIRGSSIPTLRQPRFESLPGRELLRHARSTSFPTPSALSEHLHSKKSTSIVRPLVPVVESPSLEAQVPRPPPLSLHLHSSSPPPSDFAIDVSPTVPELPGSAKSTIYSSVQDQMKRIPSLRRKLSTSRDASTATRSRSASEPTLYDTDPFAASPHHLPQPSFLELSADEAMETLELAGQISTQLAKREHGRSRSGTNLSSISLSELDSHTLAQMLSS